MTMYPGDFNGDFNGFKQQLRASPRAPLPVNLPSLKSEESPAPTRSWTFMSVRRRSPSPQPPSDPTTPPPSPEKTTPSPSPAPTSPPPAPSKPSTKPSTKICSACRQPHGKNGFSKKQWSAGTSRKCLSCTTPQAAPKPKSPKPEPPKPEPPKPEPESASESETSSTIWDLKIANAAAQQEADEVLLSLANARKSRSKPTRPPAPPPPKESTPIQPRIRHKICQTAKKGYRCKVGDSCEGAHSLAEYAPPPCSWGAKCRHVQDSPDGLINTSERPCTFIHPGETQDHYHKRSGRHAPRFWTR